MEIENIDNTVPTAIWRCDRCDTQAVVKLQPAATWEEIQHWVKFAHHRYSPECKAKQLAVKRLDLNPN